MPRRPPGSDAGSVWLRPAPARRSGPAFSRDQITRAAIGLADRDGLAAVSMRRIAAAIGSAPTSLYWYFSDQDQLHELMIDAVIGEIELAGLPGGDWRADLVSIARATRATLRQHPWLAQLGIHPVPGPQTTRYSATAMQSFRGLGLDAATEVSILAAVNTYIFGFLQRESAWQELITRTGTGAEQWADVLADHLARPAGPGRPTAQHHAVRMDLSSDNSFAFGLDCLLDGIALRIARAE
jgi:AcrR family transcriptional regulator